MKFKNKNRTLRTVAAITILMLFVAYPLYLAYAASSGPNNAGAGVDRADLGTVAWSNADGIKAAGFPVATALIPLQSTSHYLEATQYGFNIPLGATINGITVEISRQSDGGITRLIRDSVVSLVKGGTVVGDNKAKLADNWSLNTLQVGSYGGVNDLWGVTWTPADINAANFGVVLSAFNSSETEDRLATVDTIKVIIEYTPPDSTTTVDCGSGSPSLTYGSNISCTATVTGGTTENTPTGTVTWSTDGSGNFTATSCILSGAAGTSTCSVNYTPTMVGTGSHTITATYSGDENFTISSGNQIVTVDQRPITVTADPQSKVYGEADPALTYQVTSGSLVFGDAFTGTLNREAGEDANTYAIQQNTLALSANYILSYQGADLTITKRPVTITAVAKTKIYGEADPSLTYNITSGVLVLGDAFSGALTRQAGEDVGPYAIQQGTLALSNNYDLTYIGANLTITKRLVIIKADAKSKVYGEPDPVLTYQVTSGSLAFNDDFTGSLTRLSGEDVGTHAIQQGTLALTNNYDLTYLGADLTITKRPITVTADAKSKVYGEADPTFTYQLTGSLAFGDTFTGALSRQAGENFGVYAILQGSLALSNNYELTFVGANFTITKRSITVTADAKIKAWGEADPLLTFQITSGSLAFSDAFTGALIRLPGEDLGTYGIREGTLVLTDNYILTFIGADLTIIKATPTLTVTNSPVWFTGSPQAAEVDASVDGAVTNILYDGLTTPPTNAGTYVVTADFTPTDTVHYNSLTGASAGNFVINPIFTLFLPLINR